jgi:hypothetical protein
MKEYIKVKGKFFGNNLPEDTFWYIKEIGMWYICSPHIRSIWKDIKLEFQDVDFYTIL